MATETAEVKSTDLKIHNEYWSESRRREIIFNTKNGALDRRTILPAVKRTHTVKDELNFEISLVPRKVFKDIEETTYATEPFRKELGEFGE